MEKIDITYKEVAILHVQQGAAFLDDLQKYDVDYEAIATGAIEVEDYAILLWCAINGKIDLNKYTSLVINQFRAAENSEEEKVIKLITVSVLIDKGADDLQGFFRTALNLLNSHNTNKKGGCIRLTRDTVLPDILIYLRSKGAPTDIQSINYKKGNKRYKLNFKEREAKLTIYN